MGEFTISMAICSVGMLNYLRVYQHEIAQHPMGRHLAVGSPMTGLNTGSIIGYEVGSGHHLPTGHGFSHGIVDLSTANSSSFPEGTNR